MYIKCKALILWIFKRIPVLLKKVLIFNDKIANYALVIDTLILLAYKTYITCSVAEFHFGRH